MGSNMGTRITFIEASDTESSSVMQSPVWRAEYSVHIVEES